MAETPTMRAEAMEPACLKWSSDQVADWMADLGYPQYRHISKSVRDLLVVEEPYWNRSISLPHREKMGIYLERKSITGPIADNLTYMKYTKELKKEELAKNGTKR